MELLGGGVFPLEPELPVMYYWFISSLGWGKLKPLAEARQVKAKTNNFSKLYSLSLDLQSSYQRF